MTTSVLAPLPSTTSHGKVRTFYDRYWSGGFQRRQGLWRAWWQEGYDQLVAWTGPLAGKRVLNLFAGHGEDARWLGGLGAQTVAADFAQRGLRHLSLGAKPDPAWPACADAQQLPFRDRAFDVVMVINGICHTDKARVLEECRRVVRPGGKIVLLEVMRYPHVAMLARLVEPFRWHAPHRFLTVGEIRQLSQGFRQVRQRQLFLLSVLTIMAQRVAPAGRWLQQLHAAALRADRWLLHRVPCLRHVSYLSVVCLEP